MIVWILRFLAVLLLIASATWAGREFAKRHKLRAVLIYFGYVIASAMSPYLYGLFLETILHVPHQHSSEELVWLYVFIIEAAVWGIIPFVVIAAIAYVVFKKRNQLANTTTVM
jgi:MFS family permease